MVNSYIPLYRKYRPQTFKDLVGQEAISKTLSNAIKLDKVAHAYLFTGPRGTGKTSTARIFAKSLNCINGPTVEPCGECPSCIDITNGSAIDVIEIDAASNRKVDDARNLLEKVQFAAVSGKFKIYIIDEVHMLTTEAFNTLLKTLEEPPKNLVFILATTESHKVLNTIISRCQRFDFRRIKQSLITERLKEIAKIENILIDHSALSLISRRSSGGLRDALALLDQVSVLSSLDEKISDQDVLSLLGSLPEDMLVNLSNTIANKNAGELITVLNNIIQLGKEPTQIIRELMNHFRNLLLISTTGNLDEIKQLIDASDDFYAILKQQSKRFEPLEITQVIEKLSDCEKTLKSSSQQHLWLEVSLISICNRHEIQVLKDLQERLSNLESIVLEGKTSVQNIPKQQINNVTLPKPKVETLQKETVSIPNIQPAQTTTVENKVIEPAIDITITEPVKPEPETGVSSCNNLSESWQSFLDCIESIPSRMFFFSLAKPVQISSEKIVITFNHENFVKQAKEQPKFIPLEKAAQKLFGEMPQIIIRTPLPEDSNTNDSINKIPAQPKKENFEQISQEFEEIPTKKESKIAISNEVIEPLDEEVSEHINNLDNKIPSVHMSETASMVLDLFQGKIIE